MKRMPPQGRQSVEGFHNSLLQSRFEPFQKLGRKRAFRVQVYGFPAVRDGIVYDGLFAALSIDPIVGM